MFKTKSKISFYSETKAVTTQSNLALRKNQQNKVFEFLKNWHEHCFTCFSQKFIHKHLYNNFHIKQVRNFQKGHYSLSTSDVCLPREI